VKTHRLASTPPCGNPSNGKRQVLCGHYLTADKWTTDPDAVNCRVCIKASTSERTINERRLP